MNVAKEGHQIITCDGYFYAIGGFCGKIGTPKKSFKTCERVLISEIENGAEWTQDVQDLNEPRANFAAHALDNGNKIMVIGDGHFTKDARPLKMLSVEIYESSKNEWTLYNVPKP